MAEPILPRATRRGVALDWVKFDAELARDGAVDPVDKALYAAIASFVDTAERVSPEVSDPDDLPPWVPTRRRLAGCIGRSVDTVDRSTRRLEGLGLLLVHRQPDPANPRRHLPSEYELLDHHLWDERAAQRAAERAASSGGGRTHAARGGRTHAARGGRTHAAVKDLGEDLEEGRGEAGVSAVGQSAGGEARAAGSDSAAGKPAPGKGGSAADTKKSAPKTKTRKLAPPPPPVPGEEEVWAMLDAELVAIGQRRGVRPPTLRKAVRRVLGHGGGADTFALHPRGPEHAAQRLYQGWQQAGGRERATPGYAGPLEPIRRPVGYLVEVLTATPCQEQACERGVLLTTGAECTDCGERAAERAAAALRERLTAMMPGLPEPRRVGPRPEPPMRPVGTWVCEGEGCGRKGAGDRPDVPLCSDCTAEIERARREYLALHHGVSARG
ncbi:hypothetical protein [Streptomyces otsuchiensis]|uniref:hypothetical protein n=1 Tax=Streptomyces otsuchiensis TaxID=2681388 RepID=UPI001031741B|nr:hypothetical protein [Streptomyces otsuchiensis]